MNQRLSMKEKLAFGLGDTGNNIAYGAIGFYFVFFLTDVAGLPPAWAGVVFMIVRMWNAAADLIVGALSDRTVTRFGRRRPYLLLGAIPLGISFALLWQVFVQHPVGQIFYYICAGILFSTLYSLVAIPYNALLPELSRDYNERTSLSGYKMGLSFIGTLLSAVGVTFVVDFLYSGANAYRSSFPIMGILLALVTAGCILLSFAGTKERHAAGAQGGKAKLWAGLVSLLKLKEFRLVLGVFVLNMVAIDVIMALYIYFMKYVLLISDDLSFVFMAIPLVTAVLATPLWVMLSGRWGKRRTYIFSVFYFLIPLAACIFLPPGEMVAMIVVIVLIGFGISASQVLIFSILPDVVEVDEAAHGVRREGMIYGTTMFVYKIGSAIVVALTLAAMGWFGYAESPGSSSATQSETAIWGIRLLLCCIPALCLLWTAWCAKAMNASIKHTGSADSSGPNFG